MSQADDRAVAAYGRALERGQMTVSGDVDEETLAEHWPEFNARKLCAEAAREAIHQDDMRVELRHFEAAAEGLDPQYDARERAADASGFRRAGELDDARPDDRERQPDGADRDADLEAIHERLDDLEERVQDLERVANHDVPLLKAAFGALVGTRGVEDLHELPAAMEELRETIEAIDERGEEA